MNVAPENSAYASSTNTIASGGTAAAMVRTASSGIDTPVGLLGLVRNTTRVRGVIAASTRSSGKLKSGRGMTGTGRPPTTSVSNLKISNAGSGMMASGIRPSDDGRRNATAIPMMPSSSPLVSATVPAETPRYRAHASTVSEYGG